MMLKDAGITSAAVPLPLWYMLPEGFHPIDISGDLVTRMDENYESLSRLYPSASPEQIVASVLSFEAVLSKMVVDGLVHVSSFALNTEENLLLTGLCQISVVDRAPGDPNLYAHDVLESHPDSGADVHKGIVPLPAGLATVVVSDQVVPVPGVFFGVPSDREAEVRSVSFHIAFPRMPQAVVLSLSTEVFEVEEEFLELATLVAGGISFTAPLADHGFPDDSQKGPTGAAASGAQESIQRIFG
ncbi:hypothetical protein [Streptomyces gobiensis]|uniref:hypothetical protein n=1 Tax=Streptomyces gobiensis TaxID=2875706 RepID=UPI001E60CCB2|nr:hypothetical protein [Streptomyces gobiensis]UGY93913.1 hypothetical protein test1122_20790 [Streptomyces gobiensis]